eukprot:scaffold4905_cov298-Pinguiococcus_pyrenoidosus.AAC.2
MRVELLLQLWLLDGVFCILVSGLLRILHLLEHGDFDKRFLLDGYHRMRVAEGGGLPILPEVDVLVEDEVLQAEEQNEGAQARKRAYDIEPQQLTIGAITEFIPIVVHMYVVWLLIAVLVQKAEGGAKPEAGQE